MADLLDRIVRELRERKEAARAAIEETQRLEAALAALDGQRDAQPARTDASRRRRPGGRARVARGANRTALLDAVAERPGITVGEAASVTGIARATAGTTLARLAGEGALERVELPAGERGYRRAEAASEPAGGIADPSAESRPAPT